MRRKDEERIRARQLRAEGRSLRRIANELGVALSSVSVWVRDVDPEGMGRQAPRPLPECLRARRLRLVTVPVVGPKQLRRCGKCGLHTPESNFGRHTTNGRQWWCKQCFCDYFARRGQLHRNQMAAARNERRQRGRAFVAEILRSGCVDCGEMDRIVLEFDHLGSKSGNVSEMVRDAMSVRKLRDEIARCEIVCGNCHRTRTLARADDSWRLDPGRIESSRTLTDAERRNLRYLDHVLRAGECVDCGLRQPELLDFDPVRGKSGNVVYIARRGCSLAKLEAEVARCELRCVNCHRRRTVSIGRAARSAAGRDS